ncbi:MAG: superoxide dismutase [Firmicutes bacterium]|nr:superoxide dismutase [Bacillota bacterium]
MYQLPNLPYLFQDLEPYIDTHTVAIHYFKHHQNYINKLNELLMQNDYNYHYSLSELIYHIDEFPLSYREDILFNLGGVLNHNLYWRSMCADKNSKPAGQLLMAIEKAFGSYDEFWRQFKEKAMQLKGSGYTFLVLKCNGNLDIVNTSNQNTPLMDGCLPLFTVDMWEHAYYINYKNEKKKYLDNFENIADFSYASNLYNGLIK